MSDIPESYYVTNHILKVEVQEVNVLPLLTDRVYVLLTTNNHIYKNVNVGVQITKWIDLGVVTEEPSSDYIYETIPEAYVCVYHDLLELLADYGEEMLKDCKASCKDRNSNIIDCKNMFDAAVAAYKLDKQTLANILIEFVKYKINYIKGNNTTTETFIWTNEDGTQKVCTCKNGELVVEEETNLNIN